MLVLAAAWGGCEGGGPSEIRSYTDGAGRSCTVDVADISATATCDASAASLVTCDTGQEAAFVVSSDYDFDTMIYTLESCAACVDRESRMSFIQGTTCANVDCDTDLDCVYERYTCQSGICRDT